MEKSQLAAGATLGEDVMRRMREDVISCVLEPGAKLRFTSLRSIYGVSFSTLREALSRLVVEGLVVAEGQRGFYVAPITEEDLLDITDARVVIERECIGRSIERGGADWKEGIISAFHRLDRLEEAMGDELRITPDWDRLHSEFHDQLVAATDSPTFKEIRHTLFERARRYRRLSALVRKRPRQKSDEHRMMMEAVLSGDVELSQTLIERHIREIAQNIIRNGLIATREQNPA